MNKLCHEDDSTTVGVVTYPTSARGYAPPIHKFLNILEPVGQRHLISSQSICAAASESVNCHPIQDVDILGSAIIEFAFKHLLISYRILRIRSELDVLYFQKGAMGLLLPMIIAYSSRIKTCVIKNGAFTHECVDTLTPSSALLTLFEWLTFRISYACVVFTESERSEVPNKRVFVAYSNYIDSDQFAATTPVANRTYDIGFVGRFSEEKNVLNASAAIKSLVDDLNVRACFVGAGPLSQTVAEMFDENDDVAFTGWIDRSELPAHYNQIKVLVHPSKAEGLPTIILEAMSCGSIVLSTDVGSIGDVITDDKTGYLLQDTSIASIENGFRRARAGNRIQVSRQACETIKSEFSLEVGRARFEKITRTLHS